MPNLYPLLYGIGFTPWEGNTDAGPLPALLDRLPPGRALDVGCGTGRLTVLMAERGWQVTGVDGVGKALSAARARAQHAGVEDRTEFVKGDVTRLEVVLGEGTFGLVVDVGCLHGLTDSQQRAIATGVTTHTASGAVLVVLATAPRRGIGPKGIDEAGMRRLFGSPWALSAVTDSAVNGSGPLRGAAFRWYRFQR